MIWILGAIFLTIAKTIKTFPTLPKTPSFFSSTIDSITVQVNVLRIKGTPPISFKILYGTTVSPQQENSNLLPQGDGIYNITVEGLLPFTEYYFVLVATSPVGSTLSQVSAAYKTQGLPPDGVWSDPLIIHDPSFTGDQKTSIQLLFSYTKGTDAPEVIPTITRTGVYPDFIDGLGPNWLARFDGLTPDTEYTFLAKVDNGVGILTETGVLSTQSADSPPSKAPGIPVASSPITDNSIRVSFDIQDITGYPVPSLTILWGTTINNVTNDSNTEYYFNSGQNYKFATVSDLNPYTDYYFKSVASNSVVTLSSDVSNAIKTMGLGPDNPPGTPISVSKTEDSIIFTFDISNVVGIPTPNYTIIYSMNSDMSTPINPQNITILGDQIKTVTVTGLTADTTYYFQARAHNSYGTTLSDISSITTNSTPLNAPPIIPDQGWVLSWISSDSYNASFSFPKDVGGYPLPEFTLNYNSIGTLTGGELPTSGENITYVDNTPNIGEMQVNISQLTPLTTYYFQAVATNSEGHIASSVFELLTDGIAATGHTDIPVFISSTYNSITVSIATSDLSGIPFPEVRVIAKQIDVIDAQSHGALAIEGNTPGIYEATVFGLSPSTSYTLKSYTPGNSGVGYSNGYSDSSGIMAPRHRIQLY